MVDTLGSTLLGSNRARRKHSRTLAKGELVLQNKSPSRASGFRVRAAFSPFGQLRVCVMASSLLEVAILVPHVEETHVKTHPQETKGTQVHRGSIKELIATNLLF